MKTGYTGFESAGKSYYLAQDSLKVMYRNQYWAKKYKLPVRPIVSCIPYSKVFLDDAAKRGVPIIPFTSLEQIKDMKECDIFVDEIVKFFDSRFWEKLSLEIRTWVSEGAKQGVHWYFGAQNFEQVDVSFRRLVQPGDLTQVTKLIGSRRPSKTMPPIWFIWGLTLRQDYAFDEKTKETVNVGLPRFGFIRKEICQVFDTNQRIKSDNNITLRHVLAQCSDPHCTYHKVMHV